MADFIEIPLVSGNQTFTVTLGDETYKYSILFRDAVGGGWFLDIEKTDGSDAIYGIPLIPNMDLLSQHEYKGFGHLLVQTDAGLKGNPDYNDLGKTHLYWSEESWNTANGYGILGL